MQPSDITTVVEGKINPILNQMMMDLGFERGYLTDKDGFCLEVRVGGEVWSKAFGEYSKDMWQHSRALGMVSKISVRAHEGPVCDAMHPTLKANFRIRNTVSGEVALLSCFVYRDSISTSIRVIESFSSEGATHGTERNFLGHLHIDGCYNDILFGKAIRSGDPTLLVGVTLWGWPSSESFDKWTITEASFSDI